MTNDRLGEKETEIPDVIIDKSEAEALDVRIKIGIFIGVIITIITITGIIVVKMLRKDKDEKLVSDCDSVGVADIVRAWGFQFQPSSPKQEGSNIIWVWVRIWVFRACTYLHAMLPANIHSYHRFLLK